MDEISKAIHKELLNKTHWDKTYDRMSNKDKLNGLNLDYLYALKETDEYSVIAEQLCSGTYIWSIPEKILLAKAGTTKKRTVYMYNGKDRYILGVLYRALNTLHADKFAPNCFSYRTGVNTNTAVTYINKMKKKTKMYGLKIDITAYFNSVSRQHLNNCLQELFPTGTTFRTTMDKIFLDDNVTHKGTKIHEYKALIPGCALGSFFANYCLRELDLHFMNAGVVYARYSDDIIILDEKEENIALHLEFIKTKLLEYGLTINEKKYVHFQPDEAVEYLGLSLSDEGVDISEHAKQKLKKTIKRWVKAARKDIEMNDKNFDKVAKRLVNRLNWKLYKSYIADERKFGWAFYAFRYITVLDSLTEVDFYLRDRLRYLKTGKNNKANVNALNDEDFRNLGVLSLYDMYILFHEDFDYYCEVAYLI
jgi:hypothetical protein